jgi:RNA polymerase sigma-70 factor (ECF subfamily)
VQPRTDAQFGQWISAGQLRTAAEWLTRTYAGEVLGLCRAMVRDAHLAEDLAQDVFSRALASLASFRGEASARTWILKIARNRCIDHLRAQNRRLAQWGDETDPDHVADEVMLPSDLLSRKDLIEDALAELDESDRALVVLRFGHGLDYSELGAAFGVRAGTARMRVSRALQRMRNAIESEPWKEVAAAKSARRAPAQQRSQAPPSAPQPSRAPEQHSPEEPPPPLGRPAAAPARPPAGPPMPAPASAPPPPPAPGGFGSMGAPPPPPASVGYQSGGSMGPHALSEFFDHTLLPPDSSFMHRLQALVDASPL